MKIFFLVVIVCFAVSSSFCACRTCVNNLENTKKRISEEQVLTKDFWELKVRYEPKPHENLTTLYNPPGFNAKGELVKRWAIGDDHLKSWYARAYPKAWQIDYLILDPATGESLERSGGHGPPGITDGKYVFGSDYHKGLMPMECWNLDNYEHLWDGPWTLSGDHHVFIIKGALLHASQPQPAFIYRLNPETGETLWELKSIDSSWKAKWCPTDNYLIASIDFFRLEDYVRKELLKSYIYRIDPITGKSDSMELSRKGVQGMACIGNNLWVQTIDAHLLCIDLASLRETKDIKINHSFSELSKTVLSWDGPVQLTRSKLLLALYSGFLIDAPTKIEYILYDIENDQQILSHKIATLFNALTLTHSSLSGGSTQKTKARMPMLHG